MAKVHGKEALIYNGAQKIASVRDISVDVQNKTADATDHDSGGWEEVISGNKNWSGTWSNVKVIGDASQDAVFDAVTGATLVTLNVYPKGQGSGLPMYSGAALIIDWSYKAPNGDIQTIDIKFQGNQAFARSVQ
jgi:predicted secreted protein